MGLEVGSNDIVGLCVGESPLGEADGSKLTLGAKVGVVDGLEVGFLVGIIVGLVVGENEGVNVGLSVGATVGDGLGSREIVGE